MLLYKVLSQKASCEDNLFYMNSIPEIAIIEGKNLMVYGENGSGKSSLFTSLRDFLKSSVGKIDVEENIFVPTSQKTLPAYK